MDIIHEVDEDVLTKLQREYGWKERQYMEEISELKQDNQAMAAYLKKMKERVQEMKDKMKQLDVSGIKLTSL